MTTLDPRIWDRNSQAAYDALSSEKRRRRRDQVLRAIECAGPAGITVDELAQVLRLAQRSIRGRVGELQDDDLIHRTGERRTTRLNGRAWVMKGGPPPDGTQVRRSQRPTRGDRLVALEDFARRVRRAIEAKQLTGPVSAKVLGMLSDLGVTNGRKA